MNKTNLVIWVVALVCLYCGITFIVDNFEDGMKVFQWLGAFAIGMKFGEFLEYFYPLTDENED